MSNRLDLFYNAGRYKQNIKIDHRSISIDKYYRNNYKSVSNYKTRVKIREEFFKRISHAMITESFEFKLPYALGSLSIRTNKFEYKIEDGKIINKRNMVDWVSTKKMWAEIYPGKTSSELKEIPNKKLVLFVNEHSNGYMMGFYWDKFHCNVKNQSRYSFKPVKGKQEHEYYDDPDCLYYGKRGLARWVKSDERTNEYITSKKTKA